MASIGQLLTSPLNWMISALPPGVRNLLERFFGPIIPFEQPTNVIQANFRVSVLRPDDLLAMELFFYNVSLVQDPGTPGGRRLVRSQRAEAHVGVALAPQSFGEVAFTDTLEQPPIDALLSGPSWLLLKIPNGELLKTPYRLADILALLRRCEPVVTTSKQAPAPLPPPAMKNGPIDLSGVFTAIEAPYRLYLSPQSGTRWAHAPEPVTDTTTKRTELWHSRLGRAGSKPGEVNEEGGPPQVYAVWNARADNPFPLSLKAQWRQQIVDLSSNSPPNDPTLRPVSAEQVMLSGLGAWLRVHANFSTNPATEELPKPFTVVDWRHRMTMGRDQFVRVVELGNIFPFGHKAVKITITERRPFPLPQDESHQGAYLIQETYVSIRERDRTYAYPGMPLTRVRITPLLTPKIMPVPVGSHGEEAIRIVIAEGDVAGSDFLFEVTGWDLEGRPVTFETPLFWVSNAFHESWLSELIPAYQTFDPRPTRGQKIAYAPSDKPGATSHDTSSVKFTADKPASPGTGRPFQPYLESAAVRLEAVEAMTGQLTESDVSYEQRFLKGGSNPSEIYLRVNKPFTTKLVPQRAGGLAAPNFGVDALSRFAGPLSLAPNTDGVSLLDGEFSPLSVLPGIKLLGGIELGEIIRDMRVNAGSGVNIPNLTTTRTGNTIETRYEWTTENLAKDFPLFKPDTGARFSLVASLKQQLDPATGAPGASSQDVTGTLTNFGITLLPNENPTDNRELVSLGVESVVFRSIPNKKTDVAVRLRTPAIKFLGPLEFVNNLLEVIPLDGFSDPPSLDVTTDGVSLGYSLGIPTIGIGVFTLANISFSAGFYLPFVDNPMAFRLAFCERPQPFTLTVYGLGGGGFFGITIGLDGVQMVEMSLEFGAAIALNLGVASGSVSIMGGVYYQKAGTAVLLEAYIRMNGTLRVLGLISVSCTFYLSLTYIPSPDGVLKGQASLSVRVKIAFFSKTVSVTVERTLKGSDPTFREVFTSHEDRILEAPVDDWADYAAAFAAYA